VDGIAIRPALGPDRDEVLDVLGEAAAWVRSSLGIDQWPERFPSALIDDGIKRGEVFVAVRAGGAVAGTFTLLWSDPLFWEARDDAGFVHRLAIRRSQAGLGRRLLVWADAEAARRGRRYLCVDVMSQNGPLCRYYERLGFSRVGEITGPVSHPHAAAGGGWRATLYERPCAEPVDGTPRSSDARTRPQGGPPGA
jgi:GNAT superfamily N-acetyltransferase